MTIPKKDPTIPLNFPHHFLILTMPTFPSFPKFIQSIIFGPFHSQRFQLSVETIHSRKPFLLSHDDLGLFKMISAWNHHELPMVHHEQLKLVGVLEHGFYDCPFSWECHVIPTPWFFRGVGGEKPPSSKSLGDNGKFETPLDAFVQARGLLKKGKRATKIRPSYRAVYRRHSLMRLRGDAQQQSAACWTRSKEQLLDGFSPHMSIQHTNNITKTY